MPQENSDSRIRVEKVLRLERSTGFRDVAVTCGLEQFIDRHLPQAARMAEGYAKARRSERQRMVVRLLQYLEGSPSGRPMDAPPAASPSDLCAPVMWAKGVGKKRSAYLAKLGIETIEDLLLYLPRRLDDRTRFAPIGSLRDGEEVCVRGEILAVDRLRVSRNMTVIKAAIGDGSGFLYAVWFNQPWLVRQLTRGERIDLFGRVEWNRGELQLKSPVWEPEGSAVETGRWVPVYPATEGARDRYVRSVIHRNLDTYLPAVDDVLPANIREGIGIGLMPRRTAVESIHRPVNAAVFEQARRTLAFEELFLLQVGLAATARTGGGRAHRANADLVGSFLAGLPFQLTRAQRTALDEILLDLERPTRMMRLLQGDVGSGKTLVAIAAALHAIDGGCQVAFMAPTEILAEQHALTIERLLSSLPVRVRLLTGTTEEKTEVHSAVESGEIDLLVGTHALIQETVAFDDLGLVIVDEQHRFGVVQRSSIEDKGNQADVLVMSATPIPRTIALTLYGEFDVSVLDELPLGPRAIDTRWLPESERNAILGEVERFLEQGRKGYVVLPLVEESEKVDAKAAVQVMEELATRFPHVGVGLIHGRLSLREKTDVMEGFRRGEVQLLVATTVIEVGIDVPDADFMVIEHADRFGLSQLHQLRGRIGRSGQRSVCYAIADATTEEAKQRLRAFTENTDGFVIAEQDLRIRGPGDLLGTLQHGFFTRLRAVDLGADLDLMRLARDAARHMEESGAEEIRQTAERRFGDVLRFLRV